MIGNDKQNLRVAVLGVSSASGERGGAEAFYQGLLNELEKRVAKVEFISHPADESSYDRIRANYDYWSNLDLSSFDLVISTKAPTYAVRHPNHILYLVHTVRAFYDMFDTVFPRATEQHQQQREQIQALDSAAFSRVRRMFCIGDEVSRRLRKWNGVDAQTLHPPLLQNRFRSGDRADYFLVPGRLHPWKRVDLAITAFLRADLDCQLRIVGTGEAEEDLRATAGGDPRVVFLGRVDDDELIELYADCAAVIFLPVAEDYGYITLEAFASGRPVITCTDSGEPLQFVKDDLTGRVADPTEESVAEAIRAIWQNKSHAASMGANGARRIEHITWPGVVDTLLAASHEAKAAPYMRLKAAVLDMQPIEPPVGGGRLRLLGLYHNLNGFFQTEYTGTYDWPGEKWRAIQHSETLRETTVPLSREHFSAAAEISRTVGNKTVIDLTFPQLGQLSPDYVRAAIDRVIDADVVFFSHPWVYPLVARYLRPDQLVIYDSHNVEGYLRAQFLERGSGPETEILGQVVEAEYQLCRAADLVLACSQEDLELFVALYEIDPCKFRVVPNGVMTGRIHPVPDQRKAPIKQTLGLDPDRQCAIFLGSNYAPNIESARYIIVELAGEFPELQFVIAGGVGAAMPNDLPDNVVVTGFLAEDEKLSWLAAADLALNPMFGGSGTNIKMFDFMAAGLPTLTTPTGGRGITLLHPQPYRVADPGDFILALRELLDDPSAMEKLAVNARDFVERFFSWERISRRAGRLVHRAFLRKGGEPYFSVVVPTYERPAELSNLLRALETQTFSAFEVIVVDQSRARLDVSGYALDIEYAHTDVRGAIHARNYGASLATGRLIAFVDDDCVPERSWLEKARDHFEQAGHGLVGLEGEIICPEKDRSRFRVVTNVGGRGLYMTANLFVSTAAFRLAGGFDPIFDNPHFREDTDLGWRLEAFGELLRAHDVIINHPAADKSGPEDGDSGRDHFFEKDALLCEKHPERYRELFLFEGHYRKTPGFWPNLLRGAEKYGVDLQRRLLDQLPQEVLEGFGTGFDGMRGGQE
jgi:glycosyltransferase involved in cell wall biosynthesis